MTHERARNASNPDGASVRIAQGPIAVERALALDIADHVARCRADPTLLARPVRIVVPSRSLRVHVASLCARHSNGAIAGATVTTLFQLARDVLEAAGETPPIGERLFTSFVERRVRAASADWNEIEGLDDGSSAIAATLADLFDAGFDPAHESALAEALKDALGDRRDGAGGSNREFVRAARLVRTAREVATDLAAAGIGRRSLALHRAAERLRERPELVDAREIWIHGFSDATGAAADLLEALARATKTRIYWDSCAHNEFGESLRARFSIASSAASRTEPAECTLSRASSLDAEVRAVAVLIRAAIDEGVVPESIGVVARDFEVYRARVRTHFTRLAIPFSAHGVAGLDGPAERRARALARLLEAGSETSADHWFDARDESEPRAERARRASNYEMRLALRTMGASRLRAFADLDLELALAGRSFLLLPMRAAPEIAISEFDDDETEQDGESDDDTPEPSIPAARRSLPRRAVSLADLALERDRALHLFESLERWPASATSVEHSKCLAEFTRNELHWSDVTPGAAILRETLGTLERELPRELPLERGVFLRIVARAIPEHARTPYGGRGGGVQCLEVVEARARTFECLFVLGLARGRFPRTVREDPLLSDDVRRVMRRALPDLPLKSVGRDEERVLFDQLVRAAPRVSLSWLTLDEEGKALLPSVLLERIATPDVIAATPIAADVYPTRASAHSSDAHSAPRPAHEHLVLRGLAAGIAGFAPVVPVALAEARRAAGLDVARTEAIARARIAVLREFEPTRDTMDRLGPYFGYVGMLADASDPRAGDVWVTQLEGVRACGWRALLSRVLGLEAAPDPAAALPELDARTVGNTVHAVLQKLIGTESIALDAARALTARSLRWPDEKTLHKLTLECARKELADRGVALPGFEHLIAERARGFLAEARAIDEREATSPAGVATTTAGVLAAEVLGSIALADGVLGARNLAFRADRVDRVGPGLRLTDYKTGRPISKVLTEEKRHAWHRKGIARGTHLQAAAYALAAGDSGSGRYAFLTDGLAEDARIFAVTANEPGLKHEFETAVETILATWDLGVFFPRLLAEKLDHANPACATCEVSTACVRGDSTAHQRLAEFIQSELRDDDHAGAIRALWSLKEADEPHVLEAPTSETNGEPTAERKPSPRRKKGETS